MTTTLRRTVLSLGSAAGAVVLGALLPAAAQAQSVKPAGGAALDQVAIATGAALLLTAGLGWLAIGHRKGRVPWLGRLAAFSERVSGLPGWAALPAGVATGSLIIAVFGMYWDISLHIDVGRDPGPLANPAHYFILAGLFGIFTAGFFAVVIPHERTGPTALWISRDWYAPLGGVLICACAAFSLIGFPLDDIWHRLFGQDVTLWGPTHLMLIGGAAMTLVGIAVLLSEAARARRAAGGGTRELSWVLAARRVALTGGLLIGLSTFQGEFDFGVPQFRMVFAPMLVMLAAGLALVVARLWAGRGAALGAVLFFLLIRGGLALLVGPILGNPTPHFPLYIVEALCVEGVGFLVSPRRPLTFALIAGVAVGTIGLASEWAWSHAWMPLPWPSTLFPSGALLGLGMAVAGATLGAWVATRLSSERVERPAVMRPAAVVAAAVVAALTMTGLYRTNPPADLRADVTVSPVSGGARPTANVAVALTPARAADHAQWLTATAWQGGGLVVDRLRRVSEGRYVSTRPLPIYGNWKTVVRLATGTSLAAVPVFMPADPAIPVNGIAATPRASRPFVSDHKLLQRESKLSGGLVPAVAYGVVAAIALALLALLAWGLHRLGASELGGGAEPQPARRREAPGGGRPAVTA